MDDDLKAVVERLESRASSAEGFSSVVTGREIYVPLADLRTLLSALRQRDEVLREASDLIGASFGPADGDLSDKRRWSDEDACGVARQITTILTGSETNAR